MAIFKILKGASSRIDTTSTPFNEGYAYFTPDDGGFYIDAVVNSTNKRIRINEAINNEAPTYTESSTLAFLVSGEKISVAFGKLAKAVSNFISHLSDSTSHITDTERSAWNAKTSNIGTITEIQMNGISKGTNGVINLGTVLTAHQDISGKLDVNADIDGGSF